MKVTPRNRNVLLAECTSPQKEGRIIVADNGAADFLWGFVVARDETPYPTVNGAPQPHPVAPVGSLVYYRKQHAAPVLVDGRVVYFSLTTSLDPPLKKLLDGRTAPKSTPATTRKR